MKNLRMTCKLIYEVYMTYLISCENFIQIDQAVFKYNQLKVSNLLKSSIIINSKSQILYYKTKHETMFNTNEKAQVITTISYNVLAININLMNINYENMHYQYMGLFNVKLCKLPNLM